MRIVTIAALLMLGGVSAQAQEMTPDQATQALLGVGAKWAVQQLQAQHGEIDGLKKQIADLTEKCGEPCKPPAPAPKP